MSDWPEVLRASIANGKTAERVRRETREQRNRQRAGLGLRKPLQVTSPTVGPVESSKGTP